MLSVSLKEVAMIDELLASVGASGEVRLTVQKGRLCFVAQTTRIDTGPLDRIDEGRPES